MAARKESPFKSVLEPVVVDAGLAAGQLGTGAPDVQAIEDGVMPPSVIGAGPDTIVEPLPIGSGDGFRPLVEVRKNQAEHPHRAGVLDVWEERQRLLDAVMGFGMGWPIRIFGEALALGAARGIEVGHQHMIKEQIMKSAGAQFAVHQVRMDIDDGELGQRGFEIKFKAG